MIDVLLMTNRRTNPGGLTGNRTWDLLAGSQLQLLLLILFRFEISGYFPSDEFGFTAAPFEKEIWKVADDLYLKGWIRVREKFAQGELGGDVNALSYFRKWVEQQHNTSGVIHTSHFFDDNYGITRLPAPVLKCIKDMRPYRKKRLHAGKKLIRKDLSRYEAYSKAEELRREKLVDEAMVQDY
ncbi:hypothetical protein FOZ60_010012 [Perkinsus olseni]|uniref:Uncharacterized protein n=1 Tax=Perkinsus olseni TaxID=32597 RepID=A0A7J6NGN3_PEROL|nr:hypothetical protein FOZ60_010012 [Perkinsus olseni]